VPDGLPAGWNSAGCRSEGIYRRVARAAPPLSRLQRPLALAADVTHAGGAHAPLLKLRWFVPEGSPGTSRLVSEKQIWPAHLRLGLTGQLKPSCQRRLDGMAKSRPRPRQLQPCDSAAHVGGIFCRLRVQFSLPRKSLKPSLWLRRPVVAVASVV
jgi:hypothetical protein